MKFNRDMCEGDYFTEKAFLDAGFEGVDLPKETWDKISDLVQSLWYADIAQRVKCAKTMDEKDEVLFDAGVETFMYLDENNNMRCDDNDIDGMLQYWESRFKEDCEKDEEERRRDIQLLNDARKKHPGKTLVFNRINGQYEPAD